MALGPFVAQNHWDVRNTELARGFEAQMAVNHIAVTSNQTPNLDLKPNSRILPHMRSTAAVFAAAPRPQARPAVVPKLALRAETMRCLNESDQKGDPDRAQPGNLFEELTGGMLPAFGQQLLPCFLSYLHQKVELLIGLLSPATHTGFPQFFQPGGAMAQGIDLLAGAGNRPAPIYRLEPIHHAREILLAAR